MELIHNIYKAKYWNGKILERVNTERDGTNEFKNVEQGGTE